MRIIFIFLALSLQLLACALCALYTPTAHVKIASDYMQWDFSPNFSEVIKQGYDLDNSGSFEPNEIAQIKKALKDYLVPKNYLGEFAYYDLPLGSSRHIKMHFKEPIISFYNGALHMKVPFSSDFKPQENRVLRIRFSDDEGFFNFKMSEERPIGWDEFNIRTNVNLDAAFYEFSALSVINEAAKSPKAPLNEAKNEQINKGDENLLNKLASVIDYLLKQLITALKENLWFLYPLAFIYGAAHAMLPSHGKSISAAMFANGRLGAFVFAIKVGFLHLASSYAAALFFGALAAFRFANASGYFVFLLAMILIIFKLAKPKFSKLSAVKGPAKLSHFHTATNSSKVINFAKKQSRLDWLAAALLGIIPCPGMVLVLGFIAPFGARAFIAAIFIALGMSFSIYFSAYLAGLLKVNDKVQILLLALIGALALIMAIYGV